MSGLGATRDPASPEGVEIKMQLAKAIERQRCMGIVLSLLEKLYGEPSLQASYERAILVRVIEAMESE
jgi:hypothetical protein